MAASVAAAAATAEARNQYGLKSSTGAAVSNTTECQFLPHAAAAAAAAAAVTGAVGRFSQTRRQSPTD